MAYEPREVFKEKDKEKKEMEEGHEAVDYRMRGNQAFKDGNYDEAIRQYDEAILLDELYATPTGLATLYSNRAACWAQKGKHAKSLEDAERCIETDPKFTKGFNRKGHALFWLQRLDEAEKAFAEGLRLDESNDVCKRGLEECQELQERLYKRSIRGKAVKFAGRITGSLDFAKEIAEVVKMKLGGRLQIAILAVCVFLLVVGGFCFYTFKVQASSSRSAGDTSTKVVRRFKRLNGVWLSHLEAGASSNLKLLMLHRTSLSAEVEFGGIIPHLVGKAAPPGGIKIVAPDRPCHGYSLCPERGEPEDAGIALFARILSERPVAQKFAYMASGREAARHTLEIVQRRRQAARVILIRPQMLAPDTKGLSSPLVVGESVRWELLTGAEPPTDERKLAPLTIAQMPKGCVVMLIYLKEDVEDPTLKESLEAADADIVVTTRYLESFEDGLASAASAMFGGKSRAAAEEEAPPGSEPASEDETEHVTAASIGLLSRLPKVASGAASWIATLFAGNPEMEEW